MLLALAVVVGLPDRGPAWVAIPIWLVLWALYLSVVNGGQTFYAFGWESLLLEVGLLTAFFGGGRTTPPLLRHNPFPHHPPTYIRARLYRYRFTTWQERRCSRAWWARRLVGEYLPAVRLPRAGEGGPREE